MREREETPRATRTATGRQTTEEAMYTVLDTMKGFCTVQPRHSRQASPTHRHISATQGSQLLPQFQKGGERAHHCTTACTCHHQQHFYGHSAPLDPVRIHTSSPSENARRHRVLHRGTSVTGCEPANVAEPAFLKTTIHKTRLDCDLDPPPLPGASCWPAAVHSLRTTYTRTTQHGYSKARSTVYTAPGGPVTVFSVLERSWLSEVSGMLLFSTAAI
ncbi:hypothetical protein JMJ77_0006835 [Colletotrichum scovillei]|uniref:Uncharacterized protein n=1 Tax=Colletotrichum scovillei TaxID=1209932 RepID=A0A9P7RKZ4_9PEZI|nr:hypothetical protein JMJ77_0006835 [Colletotrichum scovillei]KAG7085113.1 hypothetical protein JMJ78_0010540 [Colletotrichum scovillei]